MASATALARALRFITASPVMATPVDSWFGQVDVGKMTTPNSQTVYKVNKATSHAYRA